MKQAYSSPAIMMHQAVEFGTVNISNNFFYKWCQTHMDSILCRIFYGPTNPGGDPCGCSKPLDYLNGKNIIK